MKIILLVCVWSEGSVKTGVQNPGVSGTPGDVVRGQLDLSFHMFTLCPPRFARDTGRKDTYDKTDSLSVGRPGTNRKHPFCMCKCKGMFP